MQYCQECGAPVAHGARYCGKCGSRVPVLASDIDTHPVPTQVATSVPPIDAPPRSAGWYADPENPQQRRYWDHGWTNKTLPVKQTHPVAPMQPEIRKPGFYPDPHNPNQRRLWNNGWQAKTLPNAPLKAASPTVSSADALKTVGVTPSSTPPEEDNDAEGGWRPTTSLTAPNSAAGETPWKGGGVSSASPRKSGSRPILLILGGLAVVTAVAATVWLAGGNAGSSEASSDSLDQGSVNTTSEDGRTLTPTPRVTPQSSPTAISTLPPVPVLPTAPPTLAAPASPAVPVPSACEQAMAAAAAVPLSRTNDAEFATTLRSCGSVAEWEAALIRYPKATGLTSVTRADVPLYLSAACYFVPSSSICLEAERTGYID
nr:Protein of unknown function DUF2510 [uncultured organism]